MAIPIEDPPKSGRYVRLAGEAIDLDRWCNHLARPFDPAAIRTKDGETWLASSEFEDLLSHGEVRERALLLIGRLNGAFR